MAVTYSGFSAAPQISTKVTATPGSITTVTATEVSLTVPGTQPGMHYIVTAPDLETNLGIVSAVCTTAGTLKVRFINPTAAPIVSASQTFYILGL